jgi:uroporphyrin-III C-methyltransferase
VSRAGWPDQIASDHQVDSLAQAALLHSGRPTVVTVGVGAQAGAAAPGTVGAGHSGVPKGVPTGVPAGAFHGACTAGKTIERQRRGAVLAGPFVLAP